MRRRSPGTSTVPESGRRRPARTRSSVVLPAPLGPTTTVRPEATSRSTSASAGAAREKRTPTPRSEATGAALEGYAFKDVCVLRLQGGVEPAERLLRPGFELAQHLVLDAGREDEPAQPFLAAPVVERLPGRVAGRPSRHYDLVEIPPSPVAQRLEHP